MTTELSCFSSRYGDREAVAHYGVLQMSSTGRHHSHIYSVNCHYSFQLTSTPAPHRS